MHACRIALFVLLLAGPLSAADRTHTVTPDDYFTLATITQVAVSPDGKQVAFTEGRWDKTDDQRKTDLWVIATTKDAKPKRLTFDRANDHNAKWAADSATIYFLGNRKREGEKKPPYDGTTQVWSVPAAGGDVRAVTTVAGGISGYDLAAGGVYYSVDSSTNDSDDFAALRAAHKVEYGHGIRQVSEIVRLDLTSWRTETLVSAKRYIREFAVAPTGKRIAMVTAFDDSVVKSEGESRVDVWDEGKIVTPPTEVYRAKAASPHAWLEDLAWSSDGSHFAFCAIFDGHPAEVIMGTYSAAGWEMNVVSRPAKMHVNGYGRGSGPLLKFDIDNSLTFLAERDGGSFLSKNAVLDNDIFGFDRISSITVFIAGHSQATPVVVINNNDGSRKLFDPNPHTASWKLPTVKHITWKAPDGSSVGGVLELPPGYDGKTKLPLVVAIHGGPTTSAKAALEFDPHNGRMYFATAGYAVLCPNYRGSTGYGDKFVTDLIGHENDIEVNDIIAGVQHLVKEGIADGDRVGVMGWSNGGYLTNCLITRKNLPFKLKGASSGAGIVDTVAEWGFNDEPAYPKVFKKGHPWETPDVYKATSPTYALGNVTTPTLIHVGGNDVRCPPGHSRMLYRALKEYVNVPTELVVYPGEPHGLTKGSHRKAKMLWDLAWFDKYVKNGG